MKITKRTSMTLAALLLLGLTTLGARAGILLSDNFDSYADGPLTNVSGGKWVITSKSASGAIMDVTSGAVNIGQTRNEDDNSSLSVSNSSAVFTNILYVSYTATYQILPTGNNGDYFTHFSGPAGFKCRLFGLTNNASPGSFRIGVANGSTTPVGFPSDLSLSAPHTVVARLLLNSSSNNAVSTLWIDPVNEYSSSVTATDIVTSCGINLYGFRQPGSSTVTTPGPVTLTVDNLLVGTTFADVVPSSLNPPTVLIQPVDTNIVSGANANFLTLAAGDPDLQYQWVSNGTPVLGATNLTFSVINPSVGTHNIYASITNGAGSNATRVAVLTVSSQPISPVITNQPTSVAVNVGDTANFTVVAGGVPAPAYQWKVVQGGTTNNVSGPNVSGTTTPSLTLTSVSTNQAGQYFVTITNTAGLTNSALATLTVIPPPFTNVAYLRTLQDPVTWAATNTTSLFVIQGIVTTWTNMTASTRDTEFYVQDSTAGIAIFWLGADPKTNLPPAGALVRVTGPMANFNGLLEVQPVFTNALHSVTIISTNNPLPAPQPLPFDPNVTASIPTMEMLEGSYFVASNVTLASGTTFTSGVNESVTNNVHHVLTAGMFSLSFTNEAGQTFTLFINAGTDIPNKPKPAGPVTIYGVLGDFTAAGYELTPSRYVDIVSYTHSTNVLENLTRFGDQPVNNFTESVLRPGEKLTTFVGINDPEGGSVTLTPVTAGLPGDAYWTNVTSGVSSSAAFHFQPTAADVGSNYVVALTATAGSSTTTNIWNVYVPTPVEQKLYISEVFANPTTNAGSRAFNPLQRSIDTNNVAVNDQYVELANLSDTDVALDDLNGWSIGDAASILHQFFFTGSSPILASSNSVIVYGGPKNNDPAPPGLPVLNKPASSGALSFSTGGGVVTLHNGNGYLVDRVVYPASSLATAFSRFPTVNSELIPQAYISTNFVTPGLQYDGGAWNLATKVPVGVGNVLITAGNPITLSFTANINLATTLWQAANVTDRFLVATGQQFSAVSSTFSITNPPPLRQFYFITTQ
jgi:hypothetical protein